jgi:hypothetical protein
MSCLSKGNIGRTATTASQAEAGKREHEMKKFVRFLAAAFFTIFVAEIVDLVWLGYSKATINSSLNKITIGGNGAQVSFGFPFIGVAASDISVIFVDASGNITTLTQGAGVSQYQLSLNAPVSGAIWGIGGNVTYNPSGIPIANGTTLTILRTVPLTQTVSLNNQGAFFPQAVETGLDLLAMQIQQLNELYGRAIVAPPSDPPSINLTLPPAAQRANTGLAFDGTGNVIAGVLPSSGIISSAMAPVVSAGSLAAGRTAFGLGTMAQENINGGTCGGSTLQDDGSGNARVVFATVPDAANQSVTCAFHGQVHTATGSLIYTLPRANTLFNGFGFWVYALNGPVTFPVNAADGFSGMASGASMIVPPGTQAYVTTNAAASGLWYLNLQSSVSLNAPLNLTLNCSTASNALTCAVKDRNGNDPSSASPVILAFRDPTITGGDPIPRAITGALSVTVPSGATVGTVSNQANRFWVADFDNAGTPVLCVYNSLNAAGPSIVAWDETSLASGTAIAGGSNSSQTWYCSGAVTAKSFRILGYVESTQATAGTWSSAPSKIQLFGPGVKRPGETVQVANASIAGGSVSTTAFSVIANTTIGITPSSAANLISISAFGDMQVAASQSGAIRVSLGAVNNVNLFGSTASWNNGAASALPVTAAVAGAFIPNTAAAITFNVQGKSTSGTITFPFSSPGLVTLTEIQI